MNAEEYADYTNRSTQQQQRTIGVDNLSSLKPRTLIYGTHVNDEGGKDTFHVYLDESSTIHLVIYRGNPSRVGGTLVVHHVSGFSFFPDHLVPNKRAFPQYTDAAFAAIMADLGSPLPFGAWSDPMDRGPFAGYTV